MSDNAWIGVLLCAIFFFGGWMVKGATVEWQAVADSPTTWAVIRDYGSIPHWSVRPGEESVEQNELRVCSRVPSQQWAERIARKLNGQ